MPCWKRLPKTNMQTFTITTLDELSAVAKKIAADIAKRPRAVILLEGDLGAGKTTLTQMLGKELGLEGLQSPTYSLLRSYDLAAGGTLHHLDLYRVEAREELDVAGITELLQGDGIFVIEWPRFLEDLLHGAYVLHCRLELHHDGTRLLTLE